MSRNGKFLFGALLGTLFGLVFAPKKGSELRKDLQNEISKGGHGEKTLQKTATMMGKDIADTGKEVYNDPNVQKAIKDGKKEAAKLAEQAKARIQESSGEWVQIAREKLMEGKKAMEKEAGKAFDTIKEKAHKVENNARSSAEKGASDLKNTQAKRPSKKK